MAEEVTYWMAVRRTCVRVWGKVRSAFIDHNIWGGNILSAWALSRLWSSQANDISLPKIKGGTFLDDRQISVWALNFEATYERRQHIRGGNILGVWGGCEADKRRRPTGANPSYWAIWGASIYSRGEYFSEKPIFLHGPQKWPCTRMQEPLVPGQ